VGVYNPATYQWTVKTTTIDLGVPNTSAALAAKLYVFGSGAAG
jgi:hypothetical protein